MGGDVDLDMLGTHPSHRRRGAASMLIQWGCEIADRDAVPTYVDANMYGKPLYEKFGFVDRSDPRFTTEGVASMVREPR